MAVDAVAPDGALSTVTTKASNAAVARSARHRHEMTTTTTEPAPNQGEAESRPVDGVWPRMIKKSETMKTPDRRHRPSRGHLCDWS
jgi:hypothetical protein